METLDRFQALVKEFQESANVRVVFAEPVTAEGRTVIPAARVMYGFGGGGGTGHNRTRIEADSGGGGGGGGVWARPAGAVEISARGTRFIEFGGGRRVAGALALGCALGILIGRLTARSRKG